MSRRGVNLIGNDRTHLIRRLDRLALTLEQISTEGWNTRSQVNVRSSGSGRSGDPEAARILMRLIRDVDRAITHARGALERHEERVAPHEASRIDPAARTEGPPRYRDACPECGYPISAWGPL